MKFKWYDIQKWQNHSIIQIGRSKNFLLTQRFSDIFRGYRNVKLHLNELINSATQLVSKYSIKNTGHIRNLFGKLSFFITESHTKTERIINKNCYLTGTICFSPELCQA